VSNTAIAFEHHQSAHCENGVISNLFRFHGLNISEPMAFGIGSGLFFTHIPFLKVNGIPGTSYRIWPGLIFKRASKRLGITMFTNSFNDPKRAMAELDAALEKNIPVGLVTSVYYLPYLPEAFRFHFNAHNIVVYGKRDDYYLVSDPVLEHVTEIHRDDLIRARYAKGVPEPNGKMYYPIHIPQNVDLKAAVISGMRKTAYDMSKIPIPLFGHKAIGFLASKVKDYPKAVGERRAILYLGNIIRMQEEIGTGGAGFRFVYAAFLQEAAQLLQEDWLSEKSMELTAIGDQWRDFAFNAGRICKKRQADGVSYKELSDMLMEISSKEEKLFSHIHAKLKGR